MTGKEHGKMVARCQSDLGHDFLFGVSRGEIEWHVFFEFYPETKWWKFIDVDGDAHVEYNPKQEAS